MHDFLKHYNSMEKKENLKKIFSFNKRNSIMIFAIMNFFWLFIRTGIKPSRISYPCQQLAVNSLKVSLIELLPFSIIFTYQKFIKKIFYKSRFIIPGLIILGFFMGELQNYSAYYDPPNEIIVNIKPKNANFFPATDIFFVNGRTTTVCYNELIKLMNEYNLTYYKSDIQGKNKGPQGLFGNNDVILIKINSQWDQRGGSNTDLVKEVVLSLINHPDGFLGEIIIADNGQGYGNFNYLNNNAENHSQSIQEIVKMFIDKYKVSIYDWQLIKAISVKEYSEGDLKDGYIVYSNADPETGIIVSYPKFKTVFGTSISFKYGVWNGTSYKNNFKIINMPVLKSHSVYGVTASLKNYMGVQSENEGIRTGLANGHATVGTGGMGTLMVECGIPTLNIIDAIWVNANPYPSSKTGPSTKYNEATKLNAIIAGIDPVALDYWASKYILVETAKSIGYQNINSLDPDKYERNGLREAYGVWLNLTKDELIRGGYDVTTDEERMNIHVFQDPLLTSVSTISTNSNEPHDNLLTKTIPTMEFELICSTLILIATFFIIKRNQK